jgi:16S rRNA (cytidine1402-2'-O)-methyltransferase
MTQDTKPTLTLCGTHIGTVSDIPSRSLDALKSADLVLFESERSARQFLKAAGVHRPFSVLSEHKESTALDEASEIFAQSKHVAYMSDQGMPGVEDPGQELLKLAQKHQAHIKIIPGPSALTSALAGCPFPTTPLFFAGLLPAKTEQRRSYITKTLAPMRCAIALFDTPYRLNQLLEDLRDGLGKQRMAMLAKSISLPEEAYIYASLDELAKTQTSDDKNFVLVIR